MLTVKLHRTVRNSISSGGPESMDPPSTQSQKIMGAVSVDIHWLRPHELAEISVVADNEGHQEAFYICNPAKPRPEGFAEEIVFWHGAFIENAHGSTTEVVRF